MKKSLLTLSALFLGGAAFSQVILSENFESTSGTSIPGTWTQTTLATDGGFKSGTAASLSSSSFPIPATNGTRMLATNDDGCNCDKSADRLISPSMDLSSYTSVMLSADIFYAAGTYNGDTESAKLEVSTDNGSTWTTLQTIPGDGTAWTTLSQNLTAYAGNSNVKVSILYNDNGGWLFGFVLDNFVVKQPSPNDAMLQNVSLARYAQVSTNNTLALNVKNDGSNTITSLDVTWNDGTAHTSTIPCNIAAGASATVNHPTAVNYATAVEKNITVTIDQVNASADPNTANNNGAAKINTVSQLSPKKVVIEEGTGTWCGWCPRGAVAMEAMTTAHPDDFIGIAVHNGDVMTVTAYDNGANFSGFPGCNVDRALLDQGVSEAAFESYYSDRIDLIVPASITATSSGTGSALTVDVTATFRTVFAASNYRLAVVLTEDDVTGTASGYNQTNYYAGGANGAMGGYESLPNPVPAAQMVYNHVGRALLGGYSGQAGTVPAMITDGATASYSFTYTIPGTMDRSQMHAVAMLIDQTTGEIVNAEEISIAELGINEASSINMNVYPNPATTSATVSFEGKGGEYTVSIIDITGRIYATETVSNASGAQSVNLNTSGMKAGTYLISVANEAGSFTQNLVIR